MPAKVSLSSLTPFEKAYIGNDVKVKAFLFQHIKSPNVIKWKRRPFSKNVHTYAHRQLVL